MVGRGHTHARAHLYTQLTHEHRRTHNLLLICWVLHFRKKRVYCFLWKVLVLAVLLNQKFLWHKGLRPSFCHLEEARAFWLLPFVAKKKKKNHHLTLPSTTCFIFSYMSLKKYNFDNISCKFLVWSHYFILLGQNHYFEKFSQKCSWRYAKAK